MTAHGFKRKSGNHGIVYVFAFRKQSLPEQFSIARKLSHRSVECVRPEVLNKDQQVCINEYLSGSEAVSDLSEIPECVDWNEQNENGAEQEIGKRSRECKSELFQSKPFRVNGSGYRKSSQRDLPELGGETEDIPCE
jgi:hypothetical protein